MADDELVSMIPGFFNKCRFQYGVTYPSQMTHVWKPKRKEKKKCDHRYPNVNPNVIYCFGIIQGDSKKFRGWTQTVTEWTQIVCVAVQLIP